MQIPAGESLQDHEVHERAWVIVVDGEVEITADGEERAAGGRGLMVEFSPSSERQAVLARSQNRLLLLLAPWPADGHPGTMSLSDKATVRQRAAEHRAGP